MSVDLVLVNPGERNMTYQHLGTDQAAIEPPVWAGMLSTWVERQGYTTAIIDQNALGLTAHQVANQVVDLDPTLTAVVVYGQQPSASTQLMPAAGRVCAQLDPKETVLIGGHVAALPIHTLETENVDYACADEGFDVLLGLLREMSRKEYVRRHDSIPGLVWWEDRDKPVINPSNGLIRHLDHALPQVNWGRLDMSLYRAHNWHAFGYESRQPYASIYTTLGCPYSCSFCCIHAPFKAGGNDNAHSYRMWGAERVLGQIDDLVLNYGVTHIKFADEMFVLNRRHVTAICEGLIDRDYSVNIWAYARVDSVSLDMLPMLKEAGINWLAFGLEAGDADVRASVNKGFDVTSAFDTIEAVRNAGIHVIGNYIFGLPEDTQETMEATFAMACELNANFSNFYCAMAYPGSPLYDQAMREGWELPTSWGDYSQHAYTTQPLPTKHLTAEQVVTFRDWAYKTYHTSARYLRMVKDTFGAQTAQEVAEASQTPLPRGHHAHVT